MKVISCLKRTKRHLGIKRVSFVILHLTLQSQVSRSIPKPTINTAKSGVSLLSHTNISHCITAHKCLASFFSQHLTLHSQVSFSHRQQLASFVCSRTRTRQMRNRTPLCYESPRYPPRHRVNNEEQQNLIKFKCAMYFRNKLIRLKKPFTCPICQAYKTQQLSRTSNRYYGIVAASRQRVVQDTNGPFPNYTNF